jgi:hypothetical protein
LQYIKQNNNKILGIKFPKSRENYAHSDTGSLQDTNRLDQNRTTHDILPLKQQAQRIEKEY